MKIGFFGNTNNYPFMLARALRRRGHDVLFIVDSDEQLNRPEFRYPEIGYPYPEWIHEATLGLPDVPKRARLDFALSLFAVAYPTLRQRRLVRLLRGCDVVVLSGYGPALLRKVKRPGFVMLVGFDVESLASLESPNAQVPSIRPLYLLPWRILLRQILRKIVPAQRAGIGMGKGVSYFARGLVPKGDALLDEIGVTNEQREFIMMTELDRISLVPSPQNSNVRLFCGTRFNWRLTPAMSELDYKGSDIMIRGLAQFVQRANFRLDIRFVEKGNDVAAAKTLIQELGLSDHITWLPQMSQIQIAEEIERADIILEQFGSTFIGMMGLDAMAAGRPVIANGRPDVIGPLFGNRSPVCQAATPSEVCAQLERLVPDREERERVGVESRAYVQQFFSTERAADIVCNRLSLAPPRL